MEMFPLIAITGKTTAIFSNIKIKFGGKGNTFLGKFHI